MSNFSRRMVIFAIVFLLMGCHLGEFSTGSLSPSVTRYYEIAGSDFDKAFEMALHAMEESELEIYNIEKDDGKIHAQTKSRTETFQDVRTITTKSGDIEFHLKEYKSNDNLVFTILSKASEQKYIDQFLDHFDEYVIFTPIVEIEEAEGDESEAYDNSKLSERVISEIRTGSPSLYEPKYDFSKEEIVHIQKFLNKLGYDAGPSDGTMNSKTISAIEKFKAENKILEKLF